MAEMKPVPDTLSPCVRLFIELLLHKEDAPPPSRSQTRIELGKTVESDAAKYTPLRIVTYQARNEALCTS